MRCRQCDAYIPEGIALSMCPACDQEIVYSNQTDLKSNSQTQQSAATLASVNVDPSTLSDLDLLRIRMQSFEVGDPNLQRATLLEWEKRNLSIEKIELLKAQLNPQTKNGSGFSKDVFLAPDKSSPQVLSLSIFMILSYSLLNLIVSFFSIPAANISSAVSLLCWDGIFCYQMAKQKNWARILLIIRTAVRTVYVVNGELLLENYIGAALDLSIIACQLAILSGKLDYKKGKVCAGIYSAIFVLMICFVSNRLYGGHVEKNIVRNEVTPATFNSESNYSITVPNQEWKILSKQSAAKLMGEVAERFDVAVAKNDGTAFGVFIPENLEDTQWNEGAFKKISEYMKENYLKGALNIHETFMENGVAVAGEKNEAGTPIFYLCVFKKYQTIGITTFFWTTETDKKILIEAVDAFDKNIREIPLKQRLKKMSGQEIYKKFYEAIALVRLYDEKGAIIGFGSGFNVIPEGLMITNLHLLANNGSSIDVKFPVHGAFEDVFIAGLGAEGLDLALLSFSAKNLPTVADFRTVDPEVGDKVYVISNPEGLTGSLSEGIISGIRSDKGTVLFQITAPISPGSSGGAVFNEFGQVIGISTSQFVEGQNLNFCIDINEVQKIKQFDNLFTLKELTDIANAKKK